MDWLGSEINLRFAMRLELAEEAALHPWPAALLLGNIEGSIWKMQGSRCPKGDGE